MRTRIQRWSRTGARLLVTGIGRLARSARARWRPLVILTGVLLMVTGLLLLPSAVIFVAGMLVLGSSVTGGRSGAGLSPTAAMVREWMPVTRPDHLKRLPADSLPSHFGPP